MFLDLCDLPVGTLDELFEPCTDLVAMLTRTPERLDRVPEVERERGPFTNDVEV